MKKTTLLVIAFCILVIAATVMIMTIPKTGEQNSESKTTACTGEALVCPDGSSVGRTGPNCEFTPCPEAKPEITTVTFVCDDGKNIQAKFYPQKDEFVDLILSDGRTLELPHAVSASGARYANADESMVFWNKGDNAFITENSQETFSNCNLKENNSPANSSGSVGNVGLANPASVNCTEKGGTVIIKENKLGQYGVCLFEDNRQCEEWALLRGECPIGGMKITGYENEAQAYCAITGGTVEGVGTESVLCKRVDGTLCEVTANFNGECPDPHDPNPSAGNVEAQ
ncbi:MAG TPA: DUF333 domain-containing protein [bacterium]|nr:DUF333 domain-containing protein [bacterium]